MQAFFGSRQGDARLISHVRAAHVNRDGLERLRADLRTASAELPEQCVRC